MTYYNISATKYRPAAKVYARSKITAARKIARHIDRKWSVRVLTPFESVAFLGSRHNGVESLPVMMTDENGDDIPETAFVVSH